MTSPSLDLFDEQAQSENTGDATRASPAASTMMTATSTGQSPEWGFKALDLVFEKKKAYAKTLDAAAKATLTKALWDYALARHESLMARRPAGDAAPSLLGHRSLDDRLNAALRVIQQHGIDPGDIPAARAFASVDLTHLAGESPFPFNESDQAS